MPRVKVLFPANFIASINVPFSVLSDAALKIVPGTPCHKGHLARPEAQIDQTVAKPVSKPVVAGADRVERGSHEETDAVGSSTATETEKIGFRPPLGPTTNIASTPACSGFGLFVLVGRPDRHPNSTYYILLSI